MKLQLEEASRKSEEKAVHWAVDARKQTKKEGVEDLESEERDANETTTQWIENIPRQKSLQQESEIEDLKRINIELIKQVAHLTQQVSTLQQIPQSDKVVFVERETDNSEIKNLREEVKVLQERNRLDRKNLDCTRLTDCALAENYISPTELSNSCSMDLPRCVKKYDTDTPIHSAIREESYDALSVAVANCEDIVFDINRAGYDSKTPLHLAVLNSDSASINLLLEHHSVANAQDNLGNTALHLAQSVEIVKLLLETGSANPNIPNEEGFCALHLATKRRDVDSVRILLEFNADVNAVDDKKWFTPLHLIAQECTHNQNELQEQETYLIAQEHTFTQNKVQYTLPTIEIARLLCDTTTPCKIDIHYQDKNGDTPLHHACCLRTDVAGDLVSLFLKYNGNPNIPNCRSQSPMHLLLHNTNLRKFASYHKMIHLMLDHGGDTNTPSQSGCTPLHLTLYHQDLDSAVQMLTMGAQLHLPWEKPVTWQTHWTKVDTGKVFCIDMIENKESLSRILSAIRCEQTPAPNLSRCMHCKKRIGKFGRYNHCRHCGSCICNRCSPNKLDASIFPPHCDEVHTNGKPERVCSICEQLLFSRKQVQSMIV